MIAFLDRWLLTILLLLPLAGAGAMLVIRGPRAARWTALGVALATFAASLLILVPFRWSRGGEYGYGPGGTVRMVLAVEWVPPVHAEYRVGMDGLSFPFLLLTTFLTAIALLSAGRTSRPPRTYAMMLLLEAAVLGTFVAFDLLLLFLFSALMLLPATSVAGGSASDGQRSAFPKIFAYLLAGLVCLLVMMLGEYAVSRRVLGGSFDVVQLASAPMHRQFMTPQMASASRTLFALAMVAFLVRLPVAPLHSWYVELIRDRSTATALLPAVLVPATGIYGILRLAYPLFPAAGASLWMVFAVLALFSIFYCGLCALGQEELRSTVAYAGGSLVGFALLGASAMTPAGAAAAVYVAMFVALGVAMLLLLTHSPAPTAGAPLQGLFWAAAWFFWLVMPGLLAQSLVVLAVADASLPRSYAVAIAGCVGVLLSGLYTIAMARRLWAVPAESGGGETLELSLLAAALLALGIVPGALCFTFVRPALEALFRSLL